MARFLSLLTSRKIIFDPLASRYETKISDWKTKPADSLHAWWNFKIDDWAFILSDIVLADTQAHKDYYCQTHGIHPSKIEVLPVGYDDELYKPLASKEEEGKFRVLFFGSFLPLHGVEVVVETARIISGEDPEVRFDLVGSGQTLPAVKSLACELGLENVRFEGWLPQRRLPRRIASADICLGIFGKTEKARRVIPHKVYQAMGMRKPVVTARTPAVVEFFSHKENIFLVREPQAESLAEAVLELKRDRDLRERIAAAGYRLAREEFSSPVIGRKLIRIIESQFNLF